MLPSGLQSTILFDRDQLAVRDLTPHRRPEMLPESKERHMMVRKSKHNTRLQRMLEGDTQTQPAEANIEPAGFHTLPDELLVYIFQFVRSLRFLRPA